MRTVVECPGCGTDVEIETGSRSAELFCARCDYPLFWVTPPRSLQDEDDTGDMVLRRRPGAAGIRLPATIPCPTCRELNLVMELICVRCGSPMHPEPEPEPEPELVVVVELAPPPEPEPEPGWWEPWMTAVAMILGVVIFAALVVWLF
jgi:hypothetical protein